MPKMKTNSAASKRVRVTGSGKLMHAGSAMRHNLEHKSARKRRVVLERASGYRGQRSRLYRKAKEQLLHSFTYNFRDRKARKGDFRKLWIQRINAAVRAEGITYNRFIQGLHLAGIELDRRALAELAISDPETFKAIVEQAKAALPADVNAPKEA